MKEKEKLIVAVDFDNTLIENVNYPSLNYKIKPFAEYAIKKLNKLNIKFVLNTARYGWWRIPAIIFIKYKKLPIESHLFNKKEVADVYIDDRNIFCEDINWIEIYKEILRKYEDKE